MHLIALEERFELPTGALQVHCSRQLSYSSILTTLYSPKPWSTLR